MQLLGFSFTKISAQREIKLDQSSISTDVEFLKFEKEDIPQLKDEDAIKINFKYSIIYSNQEDKSAKDPGNVEFKGIIVLSMEKEKAEEILKSWEENEISNDVRLPLINLVIRKCSPKALSLTDELGLPPPIPLPKIVSKDKKENEKKN